jgi:hypothetical protein
MQEAHTRSANRAPVQMRINSVAHALELEPRVMLESALRGRLFDAGDRYSLGMFWGVAESKLSRANLYMGTLLHVTLTSQETELYLVRRESGKE